MKNLNLDGKWRVRRVGERKSIEARVPGCIHTDLLKVGAIEDPFKGMNELDVQWVSESDWVYERTFRASTALLKHDCVLLVCEGLDTLAEISLNGKSVGKTDNQFRVYEFDIRSLIKQGTNELTVKFTSPFGYMDRETKKRNLGAARVVEWQKKGCSHVRKSPCNFGWDWGPALPTCGIWRSISISAFNLARLKDVRISQDHSLKGSVTVQVQAVLDRLQKGNLELRAVIRRKNRKVCCVTRKCSGQSAALDMTVTEPELWWPNNMGKQPLYDVDVELVDSDGNVLDTMHRRIGLRTLRLDRHADEWGESFQFVVNGVPFFAKGGNWIPADQFINRVSSDQYRFLLESCSRANMNMLRIWGGGIYEQDTFYDLCDELGICVWQDFMFACAAYPADKAFLKSVEQEATDNLRRIRHHPCIALYCGNNELEMCSLVKDRSGPSVMTVAEYDRLFNSVLPGVVAKEDPERDYWPSSPHTPDALDDANRDSIGDAHLWKVWHGKQPFEWYRECRHRFNSEFGFQSFPEPRTVATYASKDEMNITSPVMEHHQRCRIGNSTIIMYMLDWFRMPESFEMTAWLSQILQGMAMKYAVEHWRRTMPRGMGTLYWQINDCWPVASWASIDYYGRWKALQYMAKRFYAPVLVSGIEDASRNTVEVHVTSDMLDAARGTLAWRLTRTDGRVVKRGSRPVIMPALADARVVNLKFAEEVEKYGSDGVLLWIELKIGARVVSENLVTFSRPKSMDLKDPGLSFSVKALKDNAFNVTVSARNPALWAWFELQGVDAEYSDNFFHVRPGRKMNVTIKPAKKMSSGDFKRALILRSLIDTFS